MNKALEDLGLTDLEKYKIKRLLIIRTDQVSICLEDPSVSDYVEAIVRGIICELMLSGKLKWRRAFKIRLSIPER